MSLESGYRLEEMQKGTGRWDTYCKKDLINIPLFGSQKCMYSITICLPSDLIVGHITNCGKFKLIVFFFIITVLAIK